MKIIPNKRTEIKTYHKISDTISIVRYTIEDIVDHSNPPGVKDYTIGNKGFTPELCIELKLRSDKFTYNKYLFGNYLWKTDEISDKQIECMGWNTKKNQLYNVLSELTNDDIALNDNFTIQESYLKSFVGKDIFILKYVTTDEHNKDFWFITLATEPNKYKMLDLFEQYTPKDYMGNSSPDKFTDNTNQTTLNNDLPF